MTKPDDNVALGGCEETPEQRANRLIKNGDWLNNKEFPPLEFSVPEILAEGYALIAGAPKVGKSWFALSLALACARGGRALGGIKVDKRPVLYFALEDGDRRMKNRSEELVGKNNIPRLFDYSTVVESSHDLLNIARVWQDSYRSTHKPPLIIVDTLGRLSSGKGAANQYESDYKLGSDLQNLAKRIPGSTVLAVHHTNKGEHSDAFNAVSGTQGVSGACDVMMVLKRARNSDDAIVSITGRDITERELALERSGAEWHLKGGNLASAEEAVAEVRAEQAEANFSARHGDRSVAILKAFDGLGEDATLSVAEISGRTDIKNNTVSTYLSRLEKRGQLVKVGRGKYRLP